MNARDVGMLFFSGRAIQLGTPAKLSEWNNPGLNDDMVNYLLVSKVSKKFSLLPCK